MWCQDKSVLRRERAKIREGEGKRLGVGMRTSVMSFHLEYGGKN